MSQAQRCFVVFRATAVLLAAFVVSFLAAPAAMAQGGPGCARTLTADVVAIDQPVVFNRLGAQNINYMMYALKRDVVRIDPLTGEVVPGAVPGVNLAAGEVTLRPDKRPRPLVLRASAGDCLQVNFQNLLAANANPFNAANPNLQIDDQVVGRHAGFHPLGMQLVNSIADDSSNVGKNASSLVAPGGTATYKFFAEKEGTFLVTSHGAVFGGEASGGNRGVGLFAQVNVEPKRANFYRSQLTQEEMRLATKLDVTGAPMRTANGQPVMNYEARYPNSAPWDAEGKAGLPIVNMLDGNVIVHSDLNAIIVGPNNDGSFPTSTYPLESAGSRNPTVPNRLEPFREFTVIFHDEQAVAQAFPLWFNDPVLGHTLHGVRDSFPINYGSGGIGAEIIANRLRVGPMHDCLTCAYEEFFLSAYTVGDPAMLVDVPANVGLEACDPALNNCEATGPKATKALYPDDPSNVHHSYMGDFVKFRNTHAGPKEQHIFHLHNHQWLFNANDDNSNYLDAQGIGPGSGYTYEINFGGSGNRNKSAGDAIFHCHFYPHFAQGMWELWRIHDTFEEGTALAVSDPATGIHTAPFALQDGTPAAKARALPDGEIIAGTPIPALVPLPGKAMAPMPGQVEVVAKDANGDGTPESSQALVVDRTVNPGFPFWIAGIEKTVGQRAPTPPLDMLTAAKAQQLIDSGEPVNGVALWSGQGFLESVAGDGPGGGGWDGGLPRHTLHGYAAGGVSVDTQTRLDMSKVVTSAKPEYFPEEGTDLEKVAMAFHAIREHPSKAVDLFGNVTNAPFITNGAKPMASAPYHEPCIDDAGSLFLTGIEGSFFGAEGLSTKGTPQYGADAPRVYKGANIQLDVVFNKVGYHFPQQRILALWDDVAPTLSNARPPEPLVMRLNTFDCAIYLHTNLVPEAYELDDYQVRTPTDIIGQHIHLPKWDLTTTDGSGNGWNYEDGTLSPGAVRERIHAINHYNETAVTPVPTLEGETHLTELPHPFFGAGPRNTWLGARTTIQRWFSDPVVNVAGEHRGLGIIFTHDHYGPSTHQQVGLYATVLAEPPGSTWVHNETGEELGTRHDGGPTTWQAAILTDDLDGDGKPEGGESHREFYFEFGDFQHAYEDGVFVGVDRNGLVAPPDANSFRSSINPSFRQQASTGPQIPQVFPDIVRFPPTCPGGVPRPCPEAISADDVGMLVVNYRNEPVGLRVFDPRRRGPDGKRGTQAAGLAGDLAYALQTRTDRAINLLNQVQGNRVPYPELTGGLQRGDPFTPMLRAYTGDVVRIKIQAGSTEHEHNSTIHGVKWLQGGSGYGSSPTSGWRNAQNDGISEQFTFRAPMNNDVGKVGVTSDHAYTVDASQDGWWTGMWGIMRTYDEHQADLAYLPGQSAVPRINNRQDFNGSCPIDAPVKNIGVVAITANELLGNDLGATIVPGDSSAVMHEGGPLDGNGGTLVYNPRTTALSNGQAGPLHDPTGLLYVNVLDLAPVPRPNGAIPRACQENNGRPGVANPQCPVRLTAPVQPLVLRANAGDCMEVTLYNRLPDVVPDLAGFNTLLQVVNRDRDDPQGLTTFQNNLIRPSSHVGLHPQMVEYDVTKDDGVNVGLNPVQTVAPGEQRTYRWYAGDLRQDPATGPGANAVDIVATAVEFGGGNLTPADKIKQGQKGLVGALIVEPRDATWDPAEGRRTAATVTTGPGTKFRDLAVIHQKGLNHRFASGVAVPNIASEGQGIPEDSHDAGQAAINYGAEPMWFRFGFPADAPFGRGPGGLGTAPNPELAYSNALGVDGNVLPAACDPLPEPPLPAECQTVGDPATPVFQADAGDEVRMRVLLPTGVGRGSTFTLHGHLWQRDPYLVGATGFPSQSIGDNPIAFYLGSQESVTPYGHFDIRIPKAGGAFGVAGDYLYTDQASFGNTNGLWGILRVNPAPGAVVAGQ